MFRASIKADAVTCFTVKRKWNGLDHVWHTVNKNTKAFFIAAYRSRFLGVIVTGLINITFRLVRIEGPSSSLLFMSMDFCTTSVSLLILFPCHKFLFV